MSKIGRGADDGRLQQAWWWLPLPLSGSANSEGPRSKYTASLSHSCLFLACPSRSRSVEVVTLSSLCFCDGFWCETPKMRQVVLLLTMCYVASSLPPPHPAVVQVRHEEEQLPYHQRSPALRNPRLLEVLPLSSLLHHGEKIVQHREADDVDRSQIFRVLSHAGLIPRRLFHQPSRQHYAPSHNYQHNIFEQSLLTSPEILQHL